jgi:hypothetical protein
LAGAEVTPSDERGYFHTSVGRDQLRALVDAKTDEGAALAGLALSARVFDAEGKLAAKHDVELSPELGTHDCLSVRLPAKPSWRKKT